MADVLKTFQVVAQVEYDAPPLLKVFQVIAQVEYDTPPLLKVFQVIAQVEYEVTPPGTFKYIGTVPVTATPSCAHNIEFIKTVTAPVTVTPSSIYFVQLPSEYVYFGSIGVTVVPQAVLTREWAYESTIPCVVTPSCEVLLPVHFYEGSLAVEVTPSSGYRVPIIGWDKDTGWGMADVSFLSEDPPFWGVEGNIVLAINPAAESISGAGETIIAASYVPFAMGGEGVWEEFTPGQDEVVAEGGFEFGGAGGWSATSPSSEEIIGAGGFRFGGAGVLVSTVPVIPADHIVGAGGFALGGSGLLPATTPSVTVLVGSGGFRFGGFRPDALATTYPADNQDTIGAPVSLGFGGAGVFETRFPGATVIVSDGAMFQITGAGLIVTTSPPLVVITGDGGFAIGGTGQEAPGFDTWVLTGNGFEPSLYSNFDFNSFAQFRGQYYGAKDDGIYLLSGPDDDGEEIHPGVRIGPTNLGTHNQKRLRTVSIGKQSNGAKVRVQAGDREGVADVVRGHAFISRNLQGGVMTIDITDFDEVSHVEIIPLVLCW